MNNTIIKSLLLGFLPLLAFVIVEAFYGLEIGLYVAGVLSLFELIRSYIKEKKFNSFLLIDFTLILIFGLFSLSYDDPLFFKLKPAVMQLILIGFLTIVFMKPSLLEEYYKRFNFNFDINNFNALKPFFKNLILIFIIHTGLIVYAAFYLSESAWVFISGPLFYILVALLFVHNLFWKKIRHSYWISKYSSEEWIPIVDQNGNVLFPAPRSIAHKSSRYTHPTVHILFTKGKKVYLQKRGADRAVFPNLWDSSVGGHVAFGETIEDALKKECFEELNIKRFKYTFIKTFFISDDTQSELVYLFHGQTSDKITPNPEEVSGGSYLSKSEIEAMNPKELTPHLLNDELPEIYHLIN